MRPLPLLAVLVLLPCLLAGCQSGGESLGDLSSSFEGGLGRDIQGTNRRMDVYGGATRPSLPTIGMPGYGK